MNTEITNPKTLTEAVKYFADPDRAQAFFVQIRWPHGVVCPHCGGMDPHYLANQRRWKCKNKHPRQQFSAKVGTIFEESPLPLEQWLVAIWLETSAKNSISSYELARALGITQKSAWFMLHRVRRALKSGSFEKMGGTKGPVEADESFIGGKSLNMHLARRRKVFGGPGAGTRGKAAVMGLLQRHTEKGKSQVHAEVLSDMEGRTLREVIRSNVWRGSRIYTDALTAYQHLGDAYLHEFVNHAEAYVHGAVHTNGLENFWSLFKRCIRGTHVSVEPFHLAAYVDSEAFRFNNRTMNDGQRFVEALKGVSGKRLTYKALIGALEDRVENDKTGADGEGTMN